MKDLKDKGLGFRIRFRTQNILKSVLPHVSIYFKLQAIKPTLTIKASSFNEGDI
jgi:hypothetical protein